MRSFARIFSVVSSILTIFWQQHLDVAGQTFYCHGGSRGEMDVSEPSVALLSTARQFIGRPVVKTFFLPVCNLSLPLPPPCSRTYPDPIRVSLVEFRLGSSRARQLNLSGEPDLLMVEGQANWPMDADHACLPGREL